MFVVLKHNAVRAKFVHTCELSVLVLQLDDYVFITFTLAWCLTRDAIPRFSSQSVCIQRCGLFSQIYFF